MTVKSTNQHDALNALGIDGGVSLTSARATVVSPSQPEDVEPRKAKVSSRNRRMISRLESALTLLDLVLVSVVVDPAEGVVVAHDVERAVRLRVGRERGRRLGSDVVDDNVKLRMARGSRRRQSM